MTDFSDVVSGHSTTGDEVMPPFRRALEWLGPIEGGWYDGSNPRDPNPTFRGVTQKTYDGWRLLTGKPRQSVHQMTPAEHDAIYYNEYWRNAGSDTLPWPLSLVHFDAAVNHGVGRAHRFLQTTTDPLRYIEERRKFYHEIVASHPAQAPNLNGWLNRMDKLVAFIKANP